MTVVNEKATATTFSKTPCAWFVRVHYSASYLPHMSRRDIAVILERLSLDHRTSIADKACAYLQAAEFNGAIKNHPSHAAICVDIAADQ